MCQAISFRLFPLQTLTQILYELTADVMVICSPDYFLYSDSKQPPKIYNFASIYSELPELYRLTNSGIKAGKEIF